MKYKYQLNEPHRKIAKMVGIIEPPDGFTDEERVITRIISEDTVDTIYKKLPTTRMKAVAAMLENGYPLDVIASIFDVSRPRISQEIKTIKLILGGKKQRTYNWKIEAPTRYASSKKLGVADVLSILHSLIET